LKKAPNGTTRGVFVVDKSGKVLAAQAGSPTGTVDVVKKLVGGGEAAAAPAVDTAPVVADEQKLEANGVNGTNGAAAEDIAQADTAAEVKPAAV
jgi:peroxiredoxin Q/BCP